MNPVKLEELKHKHAEVAHRVHLASSNLRVLLEEADRQTDDAVAAESAGEHFVHRALAEEALHDEDQSSEGRESTDKVVHHSSGRDTVQLVDADVDSEVAMSRNKFDDGNLCFRDDCHFVGDL